MFGALKPGFRSSATLKLVSECCRQTLNRKEQLQHRAVSLRQHGFLVINKANKRLKESNTYFEQYDTGWHLLTKSI